MDKDTEVITLSEALKRINLADLDKPSYQSQFIGWTGYPRPFGCGHTGVYGFGPLKDGVAKTDRYGKDRIYQQTVRVNQHFCSGEVLFSFQSYAFSSTSKSYYAICGSVVISIDQTPDSKDTCLKVGFTG
jgi:hypothetical protein